MASKGTSVLVSISLLMTSSVILIEGNEFIGSGRTIQRHSSSDPGKLSFGVDQKVAILADEQDMWRAEINGKTGLVNKKFVIVDQNLAMDNNSNSNSEVRGDDDFSRDVHEVDEDLGVQEGAQLDQQILEEVPIGIKGKEEQGVEEKEEEQPDASEPEVPNKLIQSQQEQGQISQPSQNQQTLVLDQEAEDHLGQSEEPASVQSQTTLPETLQQSEQLDVESKSEEAHVPDSESQPKQAQSVESEPPVNTFSSEQPHLVEKPEQPAFKQSQPPSDQQPSELPKQTSSIEPQQPPSDSSFGQVQQSSAEQVHQPSSGRAPDESNEQSMVQSQQPSLGQPQNTPIGSPQRPSGATDQVGQPTLLGELDQLPRQQHEQQYPHSEQYHNSNDQHVQSSVQEPEVGSENSNSDPSMGLTLSAEDMSYESSQRNFGRFAEDDKYEYIDGTKIPLNIDATPTVQPIKPTIILQQDSEITATPSESLDTEAVMNTVSDMKSNESPHSSFGGQSENGASSYAENTVASTEKSESADTSSEDGDDDTELKENFAGIEDNYYGDDDEDQEDDEGNVDAYKEQRKAKVEEILKDNWIQTSDKDTSSQSSIQDSTNQLHDGTNNDAINTEQIVVTQESIFSHDTTEESAQDTFQENDNEGNNGPSYESDELLSPENSYPEPSLMDQDSENVLPSNMMALNERAANQPSSDDGQQQDATKTTDSFNVIDDIKFHDPSSFTDSNEMDDQVDEGFFDDFKEAQEMKEGEVDNFVPHPTTPDEIGVTNPKTVSGMENTNALNELGEDQEELTAESQQEPVLEQEQRKEGEESHVFNQLTPDQEHWVDMDTFKSDLEQHDDHDNLFQHYLQELSHFVPPWLLHSLTSTATLPPRLTLVMSCTMLLLLALWLILALVDKASRERPLLSKLAQLEKDLFKITNENKILKENRDSTVNGDSHKTSLNAIQRTIVKDPSPELVKELQATKTELEDVKRRYKNEQQSVESTKTRLEVEMANLKEELTRTQNELTESESLVQECLEEKRKSNNSSSLDLAKAIEGLRTQLQQQKELMTKYEGKIKRRDNEIKQRTQEVRKLRADAANASLQVTKLNAEKEAMTANLKELETKMAENEEATSTIEELRLEVTKAREEMEERETILEARNTEVSVLKVNVEQLKRTIGLIKAKKNTTEDQEEREEGDGWECDVEFDDEEIGGSNVAIDFDAVFNCAQLQVDLEKAQAACSHLSDQLTEAETAKESLEMSVKGNSEQLEIARKAKDNAVNERNELAKKLEVLTNYFNAREAELQKQLGMTANRLSDTESHSESAAKKLSSIVEEMEAYKAQVKTLKNEMEEQERSLKAQVAGLEQKQHESWVGAKQEARKYTEAQKELQTMRSILTAVESKLLNKEFEIDSLTKENETLKETIENISQSMRIKSEQESCFYHPVKKGLAPTSKVVSFEDNKQLILQQQGNNVYTNGDTSASSSTAAEPLSPSGPASLPPDLPPLPPLPDLWANGESRFNPSFDFRPPPLGQHGGAGYSPDSSNTEDDEAGIDNYYNNPYMPDDTYHRGHSREKSPDRMSNRSGMSSRGFNY